MNPKHEQRFVSEKWIVKGVVLQKRIASPSGRKVQQVWEAESSLVVLKYRLLGLCV